MRIPFLCVFLALGCGSVGGERGGAPDPPGDGPGDAAGAAGDPGDQGAGQGQGGEPGEDDGGGDPAGDADGQQGEAGPGGQEGDAGGEDEGGEQGGQEEGGQEGDAAGQQGGDGDPGGTEEGGDGDPGGQEEGGDGGGIDAGPRPAEKLTGIVNVTQVFALGFNVSPFRGNGVAFFSETSALPDANGCELVANAASSATPSAHAGVISVTGGTQELTLTPTEQADGTWAYGSNLREGNERLYDEGNRLTFRGAGGPHVGPFDHAMAAPDRVDIDAPTAFNKPRQRDAMRVRWNGRDEAAALVTVTPANGDLFPTEPVGSSVLICGTADTGDFTVPADKMGLLPNSDGVILAVSRIKVSEHDIDADTHLVLTAVMSTGTALEYQ